jgi:hypothetical protein
MDDRYPIQICEPQMLVCCPRNLENNAMIKSLLCTAAEKKRNEFERCCAKPSVDSLHSFPGAWA